MDTGLTHDDGLGVTVRAATRLFRSGRAPQTLRLLGNIVDQGLSSLTNLLVSLFAAHLLGLAAFGVVSIVMTVYFVCIGIARAFVCEPLMLSKAHPHERLREVVGQVASDVVCTRTGLCVGNFCHLAC